MGNNYLMQFFTYDHLPEKLQAISKPFCDLARQICEILPDNPERTTALHKLLEAKDCAVRANIFKLPPAIVIDAAGMPTSEELRKALSSRWLNLDGSMDVYKVVTWLKRLAEAGEDDRK